MANTMNDLCVVLFSKHEFVYDPGNHRGTHLTFHICKIAESAIVFLVVQQLIHNGAFGRNDFAYISERGARDVLAVFSRTLLPFVKKTQDCIILLKRICPFVKVNSRRPLRKLRAREIRKEIL